MASSTFRPDATTSSWSSASGIPIGDGEGLCETASSWRLLTGRLAPRFRHRSYSTTSEEPPLQISTATGTSPKKALTGRNGQDHQTRTVWSQRAHKTPAAATCLQWNSLRSSAGKTGQTRRRRDGLARIIRKGSDFGSQDGVIVSRTKDRTLPLSSAGHVGRKIGRMARCERPAGQLRRGRSREAR